MNRDFWRGKRVFITGHTGFKGSWLTRWLKLSGADVTGFSLDIPTQPSLYEAASIGAEIQSITGDVRDHASVTAALETANPEIVFHMAAQSLVRPSYDDPVSTYATNVMGTVNVLDVVRRLDAVKVVVVVTSDKCYENREWVWPYRETDPMGGHDPYSSSKGCTELVAAAFRQSYFAGERAARIVTVRAGNVIGGGDWAKDRLVPDLVRAFAEAKGAVIRNPDATRPWQFVLDPLSGYIRVAEAAYARDCPEDAWNFGPDANDVRPVRWIADAMVSAWGHGAQWVHDASRQPHEAFILKLDSSRARTLLGWRPSIDARTAIEWTMEWYRTWLETPGSVDALTTAQIEKFEALAQ